MVLPRSRNLFLCLPSAICSIIITCVSLCNFLFHFLLESSICILHSVKCFLQVWDLHVATCFLRNLAIHVMPLFLHCWFQGTRFQNNRKLKIGKLKNKRLATPAIFYRCWKLAQKRLSRTAGETTSINL